MLLFKEQGRFGNVRLFATRGTLSGCYFLFAHYARAWFGLGRLRRIFRRPLVTRINRLGEFLDRRTPRLADVTRPVTAIPQFFVVARK